MLALVRIDDRLIHGQVVGGWLPVVQAERIVVASDRAAADPLQTGLMRLAVPDHVDVDILTLDQAAAQLKSGTWGKERVMLLLSGVHELDRLMTLGASILHVNLGGLHDAPGRRMVAPHLAFTREEKEVLARLISEGVSFETRPLPGDAPVPVEELVPGLRKK
jgi:mannose/fructose/N-acetylgalactosamine-specific phosphotransferase system component IIB